MTSIARTAIDRHGALQKLGELAGLLALLAEDPPRVVVEIGADAGGTLWAWFQAGARRVLTVSLPDGPYASGRTLDRHDAELIAGDSHTPATRDRLVAALAGDPVDLLFIDGDHTAAGVTADLELYRPLVRPGGLVCLHDICHHPRHPDVQVDRVWQELSGDKDEIVADPQTWGGIGVLRIPGGVR